MPRAAQDGVAGLSLLDEVRDGQGYLLWSLLRAVLLWAETPAAGRGALFSPSAVASWLGALERTAPPAELAAALRRLVELLPAAATAPAELAAACGRVAEWGASASLPLTALAYRQAAALADAGDARRALEVGRAFRDRAQYPAAEAWLQRAIALARPARDWEAYTRAHLGFSRMYVGRGAYPAARRHALKALRRSRRHNLREPLAMALHEMFILEAEAGRLDEAHRHAEEAVQAYGAGHPGLVSLAYDVAYCWMELGCFSCALPVFRGVESRVEARMRPHVHGAIARAAGALGEVEAYRAAYAALAGLAVEAAGPGVAAALANAARGAISLGCWDEALPAAERALAIARERQERQDEMVAESLIEQIRLRRSAGAPAGPPTAAPQALLAEGLLRSLETLAA